MLSGIGIGVMSLMLAIGNYPWGVFGGYFRHFTLAVLNILPPLLLMLFLYCVIGRAFYAQIGERVPAEMYEELDALEKRLGK